MNRSNEQVKGELKKSKRERTSCRVVAALCLEVLSEREKREGDSGCEKRRKDKREGAGRNMIGTPSWFVCLVSQLGGLFAGYEAMWGSER